MKITERQIRQIIREELLKVHNAILSEAVKDLHGYSVTSPDSVVWGPDKMSIPRSQNPFVGGSPAFESWFNDGEQSVRFKGVRNAGTPDEETYFGRSYIYINEGDWVLIPTIWEQTPGPAKVFAIEQKSAAQVPGAYPNDTIPVARLRFDTPTGASMVNVGLAFLAKLCSDATVGGESGRDRAWQKASRFMQAHKAGEERRAEREEKRAEREMKRAEREMRAGPPPTALTQPAASAPRTIRRVGGVAAPPEPKKPTSMSGDEIRDMLGIRRRE